MTRTSGIVLVLAAALLCTAVPRAEQATDSSAPHLIVPIRGDVDLAYTKQVGKRVGNFVTTTFKVKNTTSGAIVGLKVEEFWYDEAGNTVSGDTFRYRKPFRPGEVIDVALKSPFNTKMARSLIRAAHANGKVTLKLVPKL